VIFIYNARALPLFFLNCLPPLPPLPPRDCYGSEVPTTTSNRPSDALVPQRLARASNHRLRTEIQSNACHNTLPRAKCEDLTLRCEHLTTQGAADSAPLRLSSRRSQYSGSYRRASA
jgi:hypothetical protein